MNSVITIVQIVSSSLLILCILLQHRASGLSSTFGGGSASYVQRRGAEVAIFKATIWLGIIFFGSSIVQWYV